MKKFELFAATALSLLVATPAFAQEKPVPAPAPSDTAPAGDEIVVTATKREKTLLDTPISVAVTSGQTIQQAQVRDLIDLQTLVPSLRVSQLQSSANTNFIIRGFGNGANNAGIEPSVGVFIDGVYRSRSAAQIGDLPDLKRVEVLRGPQSTLFGKNASAGIISIVTATPSFNWGGSAEVSYGNYNALVVKGSVTGPLTDELAFSLAANVNKRDGYGHDLARGGADVNNRNRAGVRTQLYYEPNADLSVRLIYDHDHIDEDCCIVANIVNGPTGAVVRALGGNLDAANPFSYNVYNNYASSNDVKNWGWSGQIDIGIGKTKLTSISAYRGVDTQTNQDSDFTSADLLGRNAMQQRIRTLTQEVRLTSNFEGPFNFLIGGFYFDERITQSNQVLFGSQFRPYADQLIRGASGNALNVGMLETTFGALEGNPAKYAGAFFKNGTGLDEHYRLTDLSYSLFGSADYEIVRGLTLTGGVNYTHDRKRFSTNVISNEGFSAINLDAPQYAPFRNQLLLQGAVAQTVGTALGLGTSANATQIAAFAGAQPAAYAQIVAGAAAYANANMNNPAANPLGSLRQLQFLPPFMNVPNAVEPGRTEDNNVSYTLRAAYKFNRHISVYATFATGFKASSVNLSRDSRPTAADLVSLRTANLAVVNLGSGSRFADPEKSRVIEGGVKMQFANWAANLAVFDQVLRGFQSNVFTGTGFALANAGKETVKGVEFDGSWNPVHPLNLTLAVTYLDPIYNSFVASAGGDISGRRPSLIPEFSITGGFAYTAEIGGGNRLILRSDYHWESKSDLDERFPGYTKEVNDWNGAVILALHKGWEFSVWGRNLTNNHYLTTIFPSVAQSGSISGYPNQPRTWGGTLRAKF